MNKITLYTTKVTTTASFIKTINNIITIYYTIISNVHEKLNYIKLVYYSLTLLYIIIGLHVFLGVFYSDVSK